MAKSKKNLSKFFQNKLSLLLPLLFFLIFIIQGINMPFVGYNAWNFNIYSLIAHNYNKFGLLPTQLTPIISVSETIPPKPDYYLHHPQLLSIIESVFFKVLGESFAVGRLSVIVFSLGSLFLIYLIATKLFSQKFGFIAALVYSILPASVLFGRMIGQEPMVLFFVLLTCYGVIMYLQTQSGRYQLIAYLSVILGTLSDWPMVYFTVCFFPYLWVRKNSDLGFKLIITSIATAAGVIIYINHFGQLYNLIGGFIVRSPGSLLHQDLWFVKWPVTITTRFLFYFNPVIFFASLTGLFFCFISIRSKDDVSYFIISLFLFGSAHIILYPEGSFGHPYWIYYLIPFIVFSTLKLIGVKKINTSMLILVFLVSTVYLYGLNTWKLKEINSNTYRYEIAKIVDKNLEPYERVVLNNTSVIDQDLFLYPFAHESVMMRNISRTELENYNHLIYSCFNKCLDDISLLPLKNKYQYMSVNYENSEALIFNLQKKSPKKFSIVTQKNLKTDPKKSTSYKNISLPKKFYNTFLSFTGAPQL